MEVYEFWFLRTKWTVRNLAVSVRRALPVSQPNLWSFLLSKASKLASWLAISGHGRNWTSTCWWRHQPICEHWVRLRLMLNAHHVGLTIRSTSECSRKSKTLPALQRKLPKTAHIPGLRASRFKNDWPRMISNVDVIPILRTANGPATSRIW